MLDRSSLLVPMKMRIANSFKRQHCKFVKIDLNKHKSSAKYFSSLVQRPLNAMFLQHSHLNNCFPNITIRNNFPTPKWPNEWCLNYSRCKTNSPLLETSFQLILPLTFQPMLPRIVQECQPKQQF